MRVGNQLKFVKCLSDVRKGLYSVRKELYGVVRTQICVIKDENNLEVFKIQMKGNSFFLDLSKD